MLMSAEDARAIAPPKPAVTHTANPIHVDIILAYIGLLIENAARAGEEKITFRCPFSTRLSCNDRFVCTDTFTPAMYEALRTKLKEKNYAVGPNYDEGDIVNPLVYRSFITISWKPPEPDQSWFSKLLAEIYCLIG